MARNGSGDFALLNPIAVANSVSNSASVNATMADVATALSDSINIDGTKAFEANQPMGGFKLTGLGSGSAATDSPTLAQVQSGIVSHATAVAGTADAIQVTFSPASTSWTLNERIRWTSGGANTVTAPTISKDGGTTSKTIKKGASAALSAGDTGASGYECEAVYNGTDVILLNPAAGSYSVNGQTNETSVDTADSLGGYDASAAAERKFTVNNVFKAVNTFTAETSVAVDDVLPLYDTSAGTADKATVQNVFKAINGLTEDTSPDTSADFVITYDTSAGDVKKVKPSNLGGSGLEYIGQVAGKNTNQDITGISAYSKILIVGHIHCGAIGNVSVAVSDDNGSSFGSKHDLSINPTGVFALYNGSAEISGTGTAATNKVVTPCFVKTDDIDAGSGTVSIYTTTATETVETGVTNALRFVSSSSSVAFSFTVYGVP